MVHNARFVPPIPQEIHLLKRLVPSLALLLPFLASGEIRLPHTLSDHAVLQRERPLHIWGWATPEARLSVRFHDQSVPAVADRIGKWDVWLAPERAGGPFTLTITGDGAEKSVTDLLVGDVWIASGQSNMEMPLAGFGPGTPVKNGEGEIAAATNPRLRIFFFDKLSSEF